MVLVIGAGLVGCCTALELARRGQNVTLVDQDEQPMNRASLRNEGKIHLGLVYANDTSLATARLQLRAALRFTPLLERWLGEKVNEIGISTPFDYLVAHDSFLSPHALEAHYRRLEQAFLAELQADPRLSYLGHRPERLFHALSPGEADERYDRRGFQRVFRTEERAVDT